jgi:hypothetical protein
MSTVAERRMNPVTMFSANPIKRRYATHGNGAFAHRGLKPTATIMRSLRDDVIEPAEWNEEAAALAAKIQDNFERLGL